MRRATARKNHRLTGKYEKLARVYSKNFGIRVNLNTMSCSTDMTGMINLPMAADHMSEADQLVLDGHFYHEALNHVVRQKENEATGAMTPKQAVVACRSAKEKSLFNVFEDISGDMLLIKDRYEGAWQARRHSIEFSIKLHADKIAKGESYTPFRMLTLEMLCQGFGHDVDWTGADIKEFVTNNLADLIERARTATTQESLELAREALRRIEEIAEDEPDEGEGDDGDAGGADDSDSSESDESGEGEGADDDDDTDTDGSKGAAGSDEGDDDDTDTDGADGSDEGADEDGDEDDANGADGDETGDDDETDTGSDSGSESSSDDTETDGDETDGSEGDGGDESDSGDDGDSGDKSTAKKILNKDGDSDDSCDREVGGEMDTPEPDFSEVIERWIEERAVETAVAKGLYLADPKVAALDSCKDAPKGSASEYKRYKDEAKRAIGGLRSRLRSVLWARSQDRILVDQKSGDLDTEALHSVKAGNKNIFTNDVKGVKMDTAIEILVDESGSMGGSREYTARVSAIAISEALDSLDIPFEVIGFHSPHGHYAVTKDGTERAYTRVMPNEYTVYKGFGKAYKVVKFAMSRISAKQENHDGDAVRFVAKRLAQQAQSRKILLVLSDGSPCAPTRNRSLLYQDLHDAVAEAEAEGIEVVGIGIQTTAVETYYKHNIVVNDLNDLPKQLMGILHKRLIKGVA